MEGWTKNYATKANLTLTSKLGVEGDWKSERNLMDVNGHNSAEEI